jgi:hypothetical protein
VNVGVTGLAPVDELDAQLEACISLAQELGLIDTIRLWI